jgi:hypothetical protein
MVVGGGDHRHGTHAGHADESGVAGRQFSVVS